MLSRYSLCSVIVLSLSFEICFSSLFILILAVCKSSLVCSDIVFPSVRDLQRVSIAETIFCALGNWVASTTAYKLSSSLIDFAFLISVWNDSSKALRRDLDLADSTTACLAV